MGPIEEKVRAASSPAEALFVLAAEVDALVERMNEAPASDGWSSWDGEAAAPVSHKAFTADVTGDNIEFAAPTDEQREIREELIERGVFEWANMQGEDVNGNKYNLNPDPEVMNDAYILGGPMWLYFGNREFILELPEAVRRTMYNDLLLVDEDTAKEFATDVMMDREEQTRANTASQFSGDLGEDDD